MRNDIVNVLDDDIHIEIEHPIDRIEVGFHKVAADIGAGIGMQDVEFAGLGQNALE